MKKVLLIDPWGINSTGDYTKGLIYGLSRIIDLTVVTNYYFENSGNNMYTLHKWFFKKSEKMEKSKFRNVVRGLEYLRTYFKILKLVKKEHYDIVHINWMLMYKLDTIFLKKLKKECVKVVYTAHNVVPHVNGENSIKELKKIYDLSDRIIVHGEQVRKEFSNYFPEFIGKVYVQLHGCNLTSNTKFEIDKIDKMVIEKFNKYEKKYIFFGNIFYNKGVDILLDFWEKNCTEKNALLIIAGKKRESYERLDELEKKIYLYKNILYMNKFVEEDLLNYMIANSNLILLPYRHASMSGVIFTAADFKKTLMCTSAGALNEYLVNGEDSFVMESEDEFRKKLLSIINSPDLYKLEEMGDKLDVNIHLKCDWNSIVVKIYDECYKAL